MANVELSLVIPTHNRVGLLKEMLACLSWQTFPLERFEVIVAVDGSGDGTQEMLQGLEVPYSLQVIYQSQSGVAVARNRAAQAARGEILLFLDDDVLPQPQLLEEHVHTQAANPRGVVLGRLIPAGDGSRKGWHIWEERVLKNHYRAISRGQRLPAGRRLYSGNFSVPVEAFVQIGGFDERFHRGEDVELGLRLERAGVPFYFNYNAVAVHRGYRNFPSWCASAHVYGRVEVILAAARKGHSIGITELYQRYRQKPALVHWMLQLSLGRMKLQPMMVQALRFAAGGINAIGLSSLAHYPYSLIFNLQHWSGVAEELGGKDAFMRFANGLMPLPPSGQRSDAPRADRSMLPVEAEVRRFGGSASD